MHRGATGEHESSVTYLETIVALCFRGNDSTENKQVGFLCYNLLDRLQKSCSPLHLSLGDLRAALCFPVISRLPHGKSRVR